MAKTEIQTEEKTSDIVTIETQRKTLSDQITDLLSAITQTSSEIQRAEQNKTRAKEDYQKHFDQGDESGMKNALAQIRSSNSQKENLINSLSDFSGKIEALQAANKNLYDKVRAVRTAAEEKLETVRAEFENVKLLYDRCNLLGSINNLNNKLQKICDQVAPPQEPPQKMTDTVNNYPGNV